MVLAAPTVQTSVPTGLVTPRPPLIVKAVLESSETVVSAVFVTRTLTFEEATSGIVQAYVPAAAEIDDVIRLG